MFIKKLKVIWAILFSSEYFVSVSNNNDSDLLPTTFTYFIGCDKSMFWAIKCFLDNNFFKREAE